MNREEFFSSWSNLHGGAKISGIVRWWLIISYALSKPLGKLSPNLITCSAFIFALGFLYWIDSPWAILFLVITLLIDGIDGSIAILSQRVSKSGAVLDAVVDRIVESAWAFGLFLLGAPWELVLTAWLLAFIQEYMRARAAGLGESNLGVVTIAERPVRASLVFITLVALQVGFGEPEIVTMVGTTSWAVMQAISCLTIFLSLKSRLRQSQH